MENRFGEILKHYWGYDSFRPLQSEAMLSIAGGRDTLVLMPTGGGKSAIYQVPALAVPGVCIVVTPLVSLMKDQVDRLRSRRIRAEAIHSGVPHHEADRLLDNCVWGDVKFLYIAPERIDSEMFRMRFAKMNVSLIAVDEAHCISQWGYDFRPAYLRIARLREIQPDVPVLALTASATAPVAGDIMDKLQFKAPNMLRTSFARPNLSYIVRHGEDKNEQLLRIINNVPGQGIVYVRTREKTVRIAELLSSNGIAAEAYHGGMGHLMRSVRQDMWQTGKIRVIVATNAFGMGIDKADVRYVVHYDICDSLEEYYQEAGRAGRDGLPAYAVMLVSSDDTVRPARRIAMDFPPLESIKAIYEKLCSHLQIGIGEGKERSYSFNMYDFCRQAGIFPPMLVNAAGILQMNGYMILTEEMENPTRIKFIVRRDHLYRVRVERAELDHFITTLLRRYTGIFTEFVAIREEEIATLSGYTVERVAELLKILRQLRIIQYIPSNRDPRIYMAEERLPLEDLRISPESYRLRREVALRRVESVIEYIEKSSCRSMSIQNYFGEDTAERCGKCDICRLRKEKGENPSRLAIARELEKIIASSPATIKEAAAAVGGDYKEVLDILKSMLEKGRVIQGRDGTLTLK